MTTCHDNMSRVTTVYHLFTKRNKITTNLIPRLSLRYGGKMGDSICLPFRLVIVSFCSNVDVNSLFKDADTRFVSERVCLKILWIEILIIVINWGFQWALFKLLLTIWSISKGKVIMISQGTYLGEELKPIIKYQLLCLCF